MRHAAPSPSLTAQAFCLLAAKTVGFVLTLALPLILVRTLSQGDFGLYKQAFLIVATAITVLPVGFGMTAYYFLPREQEHQEGVVLHVLLYHAAVGALAAIALALKPGLIAALFGSRELVPYAPLLGGVILTWTVSSFLEIIPVARQDIRASTFFIIATQASKTLFFIVAALALGTVRSLIYAALVQGLAQTGALLLYLRSRFPGYWRAFDWQLLKRQMSYGVPLGLVGILYKLQNDLPHYFVSRTFGAAAYAVYAVGVFNLPLTMLLRDSVSSVMLPTVSRLEYRKEMDKILELVARVARKLALVFFPMYLFLMIVGRDFIIVLFTRRYVDSWPIFAIYLTLIPVGVLVIDPITRAYADQRFFVLKLRLVLLTATAAALWWGTDRLGLTGTVSLVVTMQVIAAIAASVRLGHVMGLRLSDLAIFGGLGRVALAAVSAGIVCFLVRATAAYSSSIATLAIYATVYGIAYAGALWAFHVFDREELALFAEWVRKGAAFFPRPATARLAATPVTRHNDN